MGTRSIRKLTASLAFITGFVLMILGIVLLLGSLEGSPRVSEFLAFFLVIAGAFCAVLAFNISKRPVYLFFLSLLTMAGIFFFLAALKIIPLRFSQAWPLLSVFSGLALLPACWRRYGAPRFGYIVSSGAFVVLGCALLVFSLKMTPFSFKSFILAWRPLLLVLAGLTLVFTSLSARSHHGPPPAGNREGKNTGIDTVDEAQDYSRERKG